MQAPRRRSRALAIGALLLGLGWSGNVSRLDGQESPIPPALQARLLLNVLSFDRALAERAGKELVVGVVLQRKYRPSLESAEDMLAAFATVAEDDPLGLPVRVVAVELGADSDLGFELARLEIDVLYVTPTRALSSERIAVATRAHKVRSLTAVPEAVRRGLAIGLGMRDERPEILINLGAAQAEGAEFTAQLLRIARIVP